MLWSSDSSVGSCSWALIVLAEVADAERRVVVVGFMSAVTMSWYSVAGEIRRNSCWAVVEAK